VIEVSDTGPGLTPDELPRIFDRFFRGKQAESGHIPGSGLGLSIAQAIAHAHGGDLTVHSEAGRGCTFSLRLPAAR
jgi:signal transduction histidine kinase